MAELEGTTGKKPKGPGSFCIPRAAIEALLNAQADALTICAYLTLAKYTDASGMYSSASVKAVNTATGSSKAQDGPIRKAIGRLKEIRAYRLERVSNGKTGRAHEMVEQRIDLGPILFDRDAWITNTGEIPPDGPTQRAKILYVLPTFDELLKDRVWFGAGLVAGHGEHKMPLKHLKNIGDAAARLLLLMYAANDMETWGGVRPVGRSSGPWVRYEPVADNNVIRGGAILIRAKEAASIAIIDQRVSGNDENAYWRALEALESNGFFYEIVLVLNRNATPAKFPNGVSYGQIPDDAEPLYELDCRSQHGHKPKGEEGLGGITARTAGDLNYPVATAGGVFDGTYAAIVRRGQGAMIVGVYRPRYRVSNPKNIGVSDAWARINENNRETFEFLCSLREASKLPAMSPPWDRHRKAQTLEHEEDPPPF